MLHVPRRLLKTLLLSAVLIPGHAARWPVRGRRTGIGAIVGGAAGLAAGIFFGYMSGAVCDSAECEFISPYLIAIPLCTGGGTLLGAAIGAMVPKWKQVYP